MPRDAGRAEGPTRPAFSAYVASTADLDAWTRCASSEFQDQEGITFTIINMPLVHTPMIAPAPIYKNVPTLAPRKRPT